MIIDIHAHVGHHPIHEYDQEPEELLAVMDRFGVDECFLMPFPSMRVREVNDMIAKAVDAHPDRFAGFACIDPSAEDNVEEVNRAVDIGLKGIMVDPEFHRVFGRRYSLQPQAEDLVVPCV